MRWFVEISTLGRNSVQSPTLCVEASQWQPALQKARALRGDDGALSNFSIELLDDGYRAIDPAARLRYVVRRAPDDAALTPEGGAPPQPPPAADDAPPARPVADTVVYGSTGAAAVHEPEPGAARAAKTGAKTLVDFRTLSAREDNPSERSPLTYRECVYSVAGNTPEDDARAVILDRFQALRETLLSARPGKLINLAVFDHVFEGRPARRPLVTLTWKDWKGDEPELRYPLREGSLVPPAPSGPDANYPSMPPPGGSPASSPPAASSVPKSTDSPKSADAAKGSSAQKSAGAPPAAKPAPSVAKAPPKPAQRLSGDELLSELFEAFADLHFLRDALEGAEFVLALTLEKLPSEVGLVSLFDINKREFVVVRQTGGKKSILLSRLPEKDGLAPLVMRSQRALVVRDAESDARIKGDSRWSGTGIVPKNILCAPVEVSGRYLGLIELANPLDERPFDEGDGNALSYIGQQYAEFVAARGIAIDRDAILAPPKK